MNPRKLLLPTLADDPEALNRATRVLHEIEKLPDRTVPHDEARVRLAGLKTVGYRRVSKLVKEAYGPEAQTFDIEAACRDYKMLGVTRMYEDYVTASGKVIRSQMEELLRAARTGKFDCLVVGRVDRFSRNIAIGQLHLYELIAAGVIVYFAREDIAAGLDAGWRERIGDKFREAQSHLDTIRANAKYTMRQRRANGEYIGTVGYGWRRASRKLLEPIPEEQPIVERVFAEILADDKKLGEIADGLNKDGLRDRKKKLFSKSRVYQIAKNPVHMGTWRQNVDRQRGKYEEFTGKHVGIIKKPDFNAAQRILTERGQSRQPVRVAGQYVFRGLLRCAEISDPAKGTICGERFIGAASHHPAQKKWISYTHAKGVGCCSKTSTTTWGVSEKTLLRQITPILQAGKLPSEAVEVVTRYLRELDAGTRPDRAKLLAGYNEDLDRIDLAFREGAYGRNPEVAARTWRDEKAAIQKLINELPPAPELPTAAELTKLLTLRETWNEATATERNRLLRATLAAIRITRDGGADKTQLGKERTRGRQRIVELTPHPEQALLVAYVFSELKFTSGPRSELLVRISGTDTDLFRRWLRRASERSRRLRKAA